MPLRPAGAIPGIVNPWASKDNAKIAANFCFPNYDMEKPEIAWQALTVCRTNIPAERKRILADLVCFLSHRTLAELAQKVEGAYAHVNIGRWRPAYPRRRQKLPLHCGRRRSGPGGGR